MQQQFFFVVKQFIKLFTIIIELWLFHCALTINIWLSNPLNNPIWLIHFNQFFSIKKYLFH